MPKSSTPALLLTTVKSFVPRRRTAAEAEAAHEDGGSVAQIFNGRIRGEDSLVQVPSLDEKVRRCASGRRCEKVYPKSSRVSSYVRVRAEWS